MRASLARHAIDRAFWAPPVIEAGVDQCGLHAQEPRPCGHRHSLAAQRYQAVVATIILLLFLGGPSHISGFVMTIDVPTVQRVLCGWPGAYGGQKLVNVGEPEFNAAPTVMPVRFTARVVAAVFGRTIGPHFWGGRIIAVMSVSGASLGRAFLLQAAAGLGIPMHHRSAVDDEDIGGARAAAVPHAPIAPCRSQGDHCQSSEDHAGTVNESWVAGPFNLLDLNDAMFHTGIYCIRFRGRQRIFLGEK